MKKIFATAIIFSLIDICYGMEKEPFKLPSADVIKKRLEENANLVPFIDNLMKEFDLRGNSDCYLSAMELITIRNLHSYAKAADKQSVKNTYDHRLEIIQCILQDPTANEELAKIYSDEDLITLPSEIVLKERLNKNGASDLIAKTALVFELANATLYPSSIKYIIDMTLEDYEDTFGTAVPGNYLDGLVPWKNIIIGSSEKGIFHPAKCCKQFTPQENDTINQIKKRKWPIIEAIMQDYPKAIEYLKKHSSDFDNQ